MVFCPHLAWTAEGDPVPLVMPDQEVRAHIVAGPTNESEPFFVIPGETVTEEIKQRAVPRSESLEHARIRLQCTAIRDKRDPATVQPTSVSWVEGRGKMREMVNIKFSGAGLYNIPIAYQLQLIEGKLLEQPDLVVGWKLRIVRGKVYLLDGATKPWPQLPAAQHFLDARSTYFTALRSSEQGLVAQAADFLTLRQEITQYASAYRDLLLECYRAVEKSFGAERQQAMVNLLTVLMVDTLTVTFADSQDKQSIREAALISPTHPLRALWFATWAHVAQHWIGLTRGGPSEYVTLVEDALLHRITPLHMPATLVREGGRAFIAVDNINPFWALYAPPDETDVRGLFSDMCTALDAPEPALSGATVNGDILAQRIERYLTQHPYVRTLIINAFNPGRATIIADALVKIQSQPAYQHLRYDVRLFVPDPEVSGVGDAILQLIAPDAAVSKEEVDAFATSTGTHLFPKLSLAVRRTQEFRANPDYYRAHVSILLDLFPATDVGAGPPMTLIEIAPLYGLIQDFTSRYSDQEGDNPYWVWQRQPIHGIPKMQGGPDDLIALLADIPRVISGTSVTIATGNPLIDYRPVVTLSLSTDHRELLYRVHDISDWVCTIDRHLGIEFFDHGRTDLPDYLIDYVPGKLTDVGHRLIVTTRSLIEIEALLDPVLKSYKLSVQSPQIRLLLNQLRALSGRVALKLISSAQAQRAEALGLALAYCYLSYQQALRNQIIVPLDDHLDLFRRSGQAVSEFEEVAAIHRTDLALFELDGKHHTITCRLVEVKCYAQSGELSGYNSLKEIIRRQIEDSEETLRYHFDSAWREVDRPDRLLKTRELAVLLNFYLDRGVRYQQIEPEAAFEGKDLIATLEEGYQLQFTRSAFIFDFSREGTEPADIEHGIEYHRVGIDLIRTLIAQAGTNKLETQGTIVTTGETETTVPWLDKAAFLSSRLDRHTDVPKPIAEFTLLPSASDDAAPSDEPLSSQSTKPLSPTGNASLVVEEDLLEADALQEVSDEVSSTTDVSLESSILAPASYLGGQINYEQEPGLDTKVEESGRQIVSDLGPHYDIMLGTSEETPQYGLLGEVAGRRVALDLNQTHTISLFGVQGGGKSYTLGSIIEMACLSIPHINQLVSPLATVLFHYSPTREYRPEFISMIRPNNISDQVAALRERYGAEPQALRDIVLLAPKAQAEERMAEFPDITVHPITFASSELKATHWRFLMGAVGSQSLYLRQITGIMRKLRNSLTLESLLREVEQSSLADHLKDLARTRLTFAAEYIDDTQRISDLIRPGRLIIVDLRDEFIEKDEALGLFVVLLQIFSEATHRGESFNKLVVFDEAHKYIQNEDLITGLVEVVREMRHKGTSILVASQEPRSVPQSLIELSSQIILHRFNSPDWLKYIQRTNTALNGLTPEKMNSLGPGEAYVWSSKANDSSFSASAVKIRCRPRVTHHGGATKTAVVRLD